MDNHHYAAEPIHRPVDGEIRPLTTAPIDAPDEEAGSTASFPISPGPVPHHSPPALEHRTDAGSDP